MTDRFDPVASFRSMIDAGPVWDSIIDFATHRSFCGKKLYPRQLTLLKLIYLETDQMTDFDLEVIEGWRQGFKDRTAPAGVQPDVWDRVDYLRKHGYHHFPHVQAVMGRRASKGILGGIIGAERLAYMYSLDDWQSHYGLDRGVVGELTVVATSQSQAARRQFADIRRTVEGCEYLKRAVVGSRYSEFSIRTPADERRIAEMRAQKIPVDREIASLYAVAASAVSSSQRGGTGFCNMFDEFAHSVVGTGSSKSDDEIYHAFQPSLDQFGKDRFSYIPSSPYTRAGLFYELYKQGSVTMEVYNAREGRMVPSTITETDLSADPEELLDAAVAEPEMLVVQLPSWSMYERWQDAPSIPVRPGSDLRFPRFKRPIQYSPHGNAPENTAMARLRQRNPDKFRVERAAQFASVVDAYLDEAMVDRMFDPPDWREPLTGQDKGRLAYAYRAHADPSTVNANFGFAIAHLEDMPPDEFGQVWPCVIIDKLKVWKPAEFVDHTIDYVQVAAELDEYLLSFPSITTMTYDQFNSAGLISHQRRKFPRIRIAEKTFTRKENQDRCERFKSALNAGWIKSYRDDFFENGTSLLEMEMKFLQMKNGRVDRQEFGPVQTKDLFDAVAVITVDLLRDSLDRWYNGITRIAVGSTRVDALRSGRDQDRFNAEGFAATSSSPQPRRSARAQLEANRVSRERGRGIGLGDRGRGLTSPTRGRRA